MRSGRRSSNDRKRQLAAFGRFYQPGLKASSLPRADLARSSYFALECFAKNPAGFVNQTEPVSLDWVRWRFHVPPNLESQYQRALNSCQEKNAKSGRFFS
jgi:hypothetical protein